MSRMLMAVAAAVLTLGGAVGAVVIHSAGTPDDVLSVTVLAGSGTTGNWGWE